MDYVACCRCQVFRQLRSNPVESFFFQTSTVVDGDYDIGLSMAIVKTRLLCRGQFAGSARQDHRGEPERRSSQWESELGARASVGPPPNVPSVAGGDTDGRQHGGLLLVVRRRTFRDDKAPSRVMRAPQLGTRRPPHSDHRPIIGRGNINDWQIRGHPVVDPVGLSDENFSIGDKPGDDSHVAIRQPRRTAERQHAPDHGTCRAIVTAGGRLPPCAGRTFQVHPRNGSCKGGTLQCHNPADISTRRFSGGGWRRDLRLDDGRRLLA